jgi:hypothetical protein
LEAASSYLRERSAVDETTGCWLWRRSVSSNGYGNAYFDKKYILAHRLSYQTFIGPLTPGLQVDHLCRNRLCVNPEHLEEVSQQMNIRRQFDGVEDLSLCPRGHDRAFSKTDRRGYLVCSICMQKYRRVRR